MCRKIKLDHLFIPHTSKFKMDQRLKLRPTTIKIIEENRQPDSDIACSNILLDIYPQARETRKNKQIRLHQTKKFLHSKGKHQQNKKVPNEAGEHTH